ncbi:DUF2953 domain-containing protein [Methanobacterium oryzae]|uniref:DUF2953 domain-containing protein n=1 Tax=Methanobacterium oryzae TaxID=69540 RepID=UPI003D242B50
MAIITGIAIILIILLIIIIGILVIPFQISMELYREGSINQGYLKIKWIGIRFINRKIDIGSSKKKKEKKKDKTNKFDFKRIPKIITLLEESLPYLMNIFKAFLKSITIKRISLDSIIGFDDFVDTVKVSGYLWAIAPMINLLPNTYFSVEPDFHKERIDGSFLFKLKIKLLPVATAFLKALTKKPFRSLLSELRKVRA